MCWFAVLFFRSLSLQFRATLVIAVLVNCMHSIKKKNKTSRWNVKLL